MTPNPLIYSITLNENTSIAQVVSFQPTEQINISFGAPQGLTGGQGIQGVQGIQGIPGLVNRGSYTASTVYGVGDIVSYLGSSYSSRVANNTSQAPPSFPAAWTLLASKGDQGIQGVGANTTYVYSQGSSSSLWNIHHNLNRYPSVVVVDSENRVNYGDVVYVDQNSLTIGFNYAFAGSAFLN